MTALHGEVTVAAAQAATVFLNRDATLDVLMTADQTGRRLGVC